MPESLKDVMHVLIELNEDTYAWYGNDLPLVTLRKKKRKSSSGWKRKRSHSQKKLLSSLEHKQQWPSHPSTLVAVSEPRDFREGAGPSCFQTPPRLGGRASKAQPLYLFKQCVPCSQESASNLKTKPNTHILIPTPLITGLFLVFKQFPPKRTSV